MNLTTSFRPYLFFASVCTIILAGLTACGSSQYYAAHPDGIYPTPKKKHLTEQTSYDSSRTFSTGIASMERDYIYEEAYQNTDTTLTTPVITERTYTTIHHVNYMNDPYWFGFGTAALWYGNPYYSMNFYAPYYYPRHYGNYYGYQRPNNVVYGRRNTYSQNYKPVATRSYSSGKRNYQGNNYSSNSGNSYVNGKRSSNTTNNNQGSYKKVNAKRNTSSSYNNSSSRSSISSRNSTSGYSPSSSSRNYSSGSSYTPSSRSYTPSSRSYSSSSRSSGASSSRSSSRSGRR